jgi:hypothetical protein
MSAKDAEIIELVLMGIVLAFSLFGLYIAAKGRHLMRDAARDHRHRAMLDPRWHHA